MFYTSVVIELSALLMTTWLGWYVVTRSPHRPEAWLAALTAWSMCGIFVNMLFSLIPPLMPNQPEHWLRLPLLLFWPLGILQQDASAWLQGWMSTLAPNFWFHASMLLRPGKMNPQRRLVISGGYIVTAVGVAIQAWQPAAYKIISGDPLYLNSLRGGAVYGLFLLALVGYCSLSAYNLLLAIRVETRRSARRQLILLVAATVLAGLTGPLGLLAAFLNIQVPMFVIALMLAGSVLVTSYGVARYNALMENRIFFRDFFYSALTVSAAVGFCLAITWAFNRLYDFEPFVYVAVGLLAVISYSLLDLARRQSDFSVYQQENHKLRERLRTQSGQDEANILAALERSLQTVCAPMQAGYAVLLAHQDGHAIQAAAYQWQQAALKLPAGVVAADDLQRLKRGELPAPLADAALLLPIYLNDRQIGALVVGPAEHGVAFSPVELEILYEFNDYLAGRLETLALNQHLQEQAEQKPPPELLLNPAMNLISAQSVELGLRNLHDYQKLAELPLAELQLVRQSCCNPTTHIEIGKAIHNLLCTTLEQLHPADEARQPVGSSMPRRSWYPYIILSDAYIHCLPNREIMDRLYISEGTFNRTRRSAIYSLTRLLVEMEDRARQ